MSLQPGQYNLSPIIIGMTWHPPPFYISINGDEKNLTGCVVRILIVQDEVVKKTLFSGDGLAIIAAEGCISPVLSAAETLTALDPGQYGYRLEITEVGGVEKNRYLEGQLEVRT